MKSLPEDSDPCRGGEVGILRSTADDIQEFTTRKKYEVRGRHWKARSGGALPFSTVGWK